MATPDKGGGVNPKDLKQGEAAASSLKQMIEKVAKLADELGKSSPPSDAKAKKEYEALLQKFCKGAEQVDKATTLLKKNEEAARKGMSKDDQKVAAKLGKSVGEIDKLGTDIKKAALKSQANAKKGGAGKGDDKATLKKMHAAEQAMSALGKQIAPSQAKILIGK